MFNGAGADAQRFGHFSYFPWAAMIAGIAQQQRSGVDELGSRCLSAVRECFQPAAFFFGEGNLISGCHAPIIRQRKSMVNMRNVMCYTLLG